MHYLSRDEIERIAEGIIDQYKVKAQVTRFPGEDGGRIYVSFGLLSSRDDDASNGCDLWL